MKRITEFERQLNNKLAEICNPADPFVVARENWAPYKEAMLPAIAGVYFLMNRLEILYVGLTRNIYLRLPQHRQDGKRFTHFSYIEVPTLLLEEVEAFYIRLLEPPLNVKRPMGGPAHG